MSAIVTPGRDETGNGTALRHNEAAKSGEVLAPIIAGARARGIADAFQMLGEAAILLDFSGYVLHVGEGAEPLLGCALSITSNHVTPTSRKNADQLQALLEAGLSECGPARLEMDLMCAEEGMRQRVRLYHVDNSSDSRQLLSAVLVLEPPRRVRRLRARTRKVAEPSPA
jgi:hypothetical protein